MLLPISKVEQITWEKATTVFVLFLTHFMSIRMSPRHVLFKLKSIDNTTINIASINSNTEVKIT